MTGQMCLFKFWEYEEDSGTMMAKCPTCECRMPIGIYAYGNPYHFCPYCGERLEEGRVMEAGRRIYGWSR